MQGLSLVLMFIFMTIISWGNYGPLMHAGQAGMLGASLKPFICVGVAYFLIAVCVPALILKVRNETGRFTARGVWWSLFAGAVGALGALGIILAFKFRGSPVFVMPLVFGLAPVVNTFVTMYLSKTYDKAGALFFAGLLMVALGAAGVLYFKPSAKNVVINETAAGAITVSLTESRDGGTATQTWEAASLEELQSNPELATAYKWYTRKKPLSIRELLLIIASIGMTALCWGSYGPTLHKGQAMMEGSRLRPFMCVGMAYFIIAVVMPILILGFWKEGGTWTGTGVFWSLGAGAAGAVGAMGIIMAFNNGGKPIFVMPFVFGGAPVMNTFVTVLTEGTFNQLQPAFFVALLLVAAGAVTALVFVPKAPPPKPSEAS
ncbi:hypothetical protein [Acanthopleuribacter pedis]|uniref:EamA domain-containing protein n=1 Tax=Acanthopleuribacter pedis TaxID=442870 RepID=A0A8J7QK50_9BACT|nr:hypothetical protein [Acanthopleuribacter pedis]MBO1319660.1 hypothetical protein [Acanthopleuribacter pedis]